MARVLGPDEISRMAMRLTRRRTLEALPGKTVKVYTDQALTTLASIAAYQPGSPSTPGSVIAGSVVQVGQDGRLPLFWFPDGVDTLWGSAAGGPPFPLTTRVAASAGSSGGAVATVVVADPTGNVAADTTTLQTALNTAATAGAGRVVLSAGKDYTVSGVTIDTGVTLDLNRGGLTLAAGSSASLVATKDYVTLVGGDTTGGPRDWGIVNGYLDGNKANNTATDKPTLAIYGRRYTLNDLLIRNGKGTGLHTKWSTTSPFQTPNGFESFVTDVYIHSCDGDGINFEGPHDAYFQNFFIVKCGTTASSAPLRLPDASGRANGSNFDKFHIYGGNGYNYGAVLNTAGCKFTNFVVEGAQLGQVHVQASQIQLEGAHLYSGGIQTASVKGIVIGDNTHTGINGLTIKAKIENCGGGGFDFTYMGDHNTIDAHVYYYLASPAPTLTALGYVTAPSRYNRIQLYVADNTFAPTTHNINQTVGPMRIGRAVAAANDTRDLVDVRDEAGAVMFTIDSRGRIRSKGGSTPASGNGTQIGTGGTPSVSVSGTDVAGTITIVTGSTGPAAGQLGYVTFSSAQSSTPRAVVLCPKDAASAALQYFVTSNTTGFSVRCGATPAASTTYTFDYFVVGGA